MSNNRQIAANRLNAQSSTGPCTPVGKASVSRNALKHGLTGRNVVLPSEDPDDFESFRKDLLTSLDPRGDLEGVLAEKIVTDCWRLRRVPIFEAALHRRGSAELLVSKAEDSVKRYEVSDADTISALLKRTEVAEDNRQAHQEAERELVRSRTKLEDPSFNVTRGLEKYPAAFLNLWRHEDVITRSMLRTLHELERLQAKRFGENVPIPAVVDVNVSVSEPPSVDLGVLDEKTGG